MVDVLQVVFHSFWTFAGTVILFGMFVKLVAVLLLGTAAIIHGKRTEGF
jgi:hypothetical protein